MQALHTVLPCFWSEPPLRRGPTVRSMVAEAGAIGARCWPPTSRSALPSAIRIGWTPWPPLVPDSRSVGFADVPPWEGDDPMAQRIESEGMTALFRCVGQSSRSRGASRISR